MDIAELYDLFLNSSGVTTDSRTIRSGEIFFGLSGPNFDGNSFATTALENGALYAIIDDQAFDTHDNTILVSDALTCLQNLAAHHRAQWTIPIIAITGTNGKTTTKELLHSIIRTSYNTVATSGNLNNHIGVPMTLLKIKNGTEIGIIEMGANHIGEIETLCQIASPTHGIITNIGKAHLEGFENEAGVRQAKGELYNFLAENNGAVFINNDHAYLLEMAEKIETTCSYGSTSEADIRGKLMATFPYLAIQYQDKDMSPEIATHLIGDYNFENILAAICIGNYFKVTPDHIKQGIESYIPDNNRSQIIERSSNTFLLDAYNANPSNMKAAISNFAALEANKKVVILGDMLELGAESQNEHLHILDMLKELSFKSVILVGKEFKKVNEKIKYPHFEDIDALKRWFEGENFGDTFFLIKGSRKVGLERLLS